ncbi:hypothetical protein BH11PSE11_BH11PSE11_25790 [soil metagenome]
MHRFALFRFLRSLGYLAAVLFANAVNASSDHWNTYRAFSNTRDLTQDTVLDYGFPGKHYLRNDVVAAASESFAPGSRIVAADAALSPYQGMWSNENEAGWGVSITQHGAMIFATIYTYDAAGAPTWYVMPRCPVVNTGCSSELYQVHGGTPPDVDWNGAGKIVTRVGTGTLSFSDALHGTLDVNINGVQGSKAIAQQIFASGSAPASPDLTDLWWNANESGWGMALTQQFGTIFSAWFAYDFNGKPMWYVVPDCAVIAVDTIILCKGDLYQVTGGSPLTAPWNEANKVITRVGTVAFVFTDANNATAYYIINEQPGSRAITRQLF